MPLILQGATSGQATIQATDAATVTLTLPASTGTLVVTGGAQTIEFADGSAAAPSITNSGDTNTGMFFPAADTIAFTEGGVESMRIDASGNVGIGGTPVTYKLEVFGATSGRSAITSINSNSAGSAGFHVGSDAGENIGNIVGFGTTHPTKANSMQIGTEQAYPLFFQTNGTERMRIDSSGNLLVAKTTGTAAGINVGSIQGGKEIMSCGSVAGLAWENRSGGVTSSSNWYMWYTTSGTIFLYNGTGNAASINPSTGVYTPLSDVNKKKDFAPSTLGLNAVMQLKPTLYRMKSEDESVPLSLGFIAQDMQNVIPEAYVETQNKNANGEADTFIGLQSMPIIATLTKAIQELKATVDAQAARIAALEGAK